MRSSGCGWWLRSAICCCLFSALSPHRHAPRRHLLVRRSWCWRRDRYPSLPSQFHGCCLGLRCTLDDPRLDHASSPWLLSGPHATSTTTERCRRSTTFYSFGISTGRRLPGEPETPRDEPPPPPPRCYRYRHPSPSISSVSKAAPPPEPVPVKVSVAEHAIQTDDSLFETPSPTV